MDIALETVRAAAAAVGDEDIVSSDDVVFPVSTVDSSGIGDPARAVWYASSSSDDVLSGLVESATLLAASSNLCCKPFCDCAPSNKYVSSAPFFPSAFMPIGDGTGIKLDSTSFKCLCISLSSTVSSKRASLPVPIF
jgi:hypothetical protein